MKNRSLTNMYEKGQSVWLDYLSRDLIENGTLEKLVEMGVTGVTSNPSIFNKAIKGSEFYLADINRMKTEEYGNFYVYDELTVRDVKSGCDILSGVYEKTGGRDGYVSLEINPQIAERFEESLEEGRRLWAKVDRPNLMLKVPATTAGFKVAELLTEEGMNINITLIFSMDQYRKAAHSYLRGIEKRLSRGEEVRHIHSVTSFFVSRIDAEVDTRIETMEKSELYPLLGRAAVACGRMLYGEYQKICREEFRQIEKRGGNRQRILWASTGIKNERYHPLKYVEELFAPGTVTTLPEETLKLLMAEQYEPKTFNLETDDEQGVVRKLKESGLDLNEVTSMLQSRGVELFSDAFEDLLYTLEGMLK